MVAKLLVGEVQLRSCKAFKVTDPPYRWGRRLFLLMTDRPWFDQETGTLLIDEYVVEMDSYRRIVEDEAITDAELVEQTQRVASLLRQLEQVAKQMVHA